MINLRARLCAHSVQGLRLGLKSASTVVIALIARIAADQQSASTVVIADTARSQCGGSSICEHGRASAVVYALACQVVRRV